MYQFFICDNRARPVVTNVNNRLASSGYISHNFQQILVTKTSTYGESFNIIALNEALFFHKACISYIPRHFRRYWHSAIVKANLIDQCSFYAVESLQRDDKISKTTEPFSTEHRGKSCPPSNSLTFPNISPTITCVLLSRSSSIYVVQIASSVLCIHRAMSLV